MAIELKQSLKMSQQLLITPQLQQAIKLLQLSRAELVETVQKELLENPVLEEDHSENEPNHEAKGESADSSEPAERLSDLSTSQSDDKVSESTDGERKDDFDWANYVESTQNGGREPRSYAVNNEEAPNYENMVSSASTLQDHLEWQIKMGSLLPEEEEASLVIIGNLDDNGYLQSTLEDLSERSRFNFDELEDALCIIQDLDPPGVGARDLKECLLLQIRDAGPDKTILAEIINKHLDFIEKRNYPGLAKKMGITLHKAKSLAEAIFCLDPKPGRIFTKNDAQYITPDVYIKEMGGEFVVVLNEDGMPKLQISNLYKSAILKNESTNTASEKKSDLESQAQDYIQDKLKSALWLIKSIHQRQKTLYKVTKSIARFQKEFLEKGVQHLKPLVLRDVADEIGVHESTVSRATSGKYVHTPQGIFELKYFFNTGLSNASGGQDFANEAVKQMIKQFIGEEDRKKPLSDQAIAAMLKAQNISIARRTVAKYREMLGILPSSRRKKLA
ncbi:MAG: RNA polymerase factor sigma-54 [Deltaproteobacteria bacterium]|nr:RNA polymerase factor sigma-54 [Deltaproteobacteria bacterium]